MDFSHLDEEGTLRMVDVGGKNESEREAVAKGRVFMTAQTLSALRSQALPKGDVLSVARVAGILAAKKTPELIPLCHSLALDWVGVEFEITESPPSVEICATARCTGKTGVEMEALTAVSVAALTIYDMCKSVEKGIRIGEIRLHRKSGGKSGTWEEK